MLRYINICMHNYVLSIYISQIIIFIGYNLNTKALLLSWRQSIKAMTFIFVFLAIRFYLAMQLNKF